MATPDFRIQVDLNATGNLATVMETASKSAERFARSADKVTPAVERASRATDFWSRSASSLIGNLSANVISRVSNSFINLAQATVRAAEDWIRFENAIRTATDSQSEMVRIQEEVFRMSQRTRTAVLDNAQSFLRFSLASERLNVSSETNIRRLETFSKLMQATGATSRETSQALVQLSQAFASNRLQGDEFRTLAEAAPEFLRGMADALGVTTGQLRQMSREGAITAEVMGEALDSLKERSDALFESMNVTLGGAFKTIENAFGKLTGAMDDALRITPAITESMLGLAAAFERIAESDVVRFLRELTTALKNLGSAGVDFFNTKLGDTEITLGKVITQVTLGQLGVRSLGGAIKGAANALESFNARDFDREMRDLNARLRATSDEIERLKKFIEEAERLSKRPGGESFARLIAGGGLQEELERTKQQFRLIEQQLQNVGDAAQKTTTEMQLFSDGAVKSSKKVNEAEKETAADRRKRESAAKKAARELAAERTAAFNLFRRQLEEEKQRVKRLQVAHDALAQTWLDFPPKLQQMETANRQSEEFIQSLRDWSDILVRLDKDWSNFLATLLAGLAQVIELSDEAKLNFVDMVGIGLTGAGVGAQLGQAAGGSQPSGIGAGIGGLIGFGLTAGTNPILAGVSAASAIFAGSTAGGFIESIFGGGRERSPEISIGGAGTTTGMVGGTQAIGPFGRFGIRNPRGADDFAAFAQVAQLISTTQRQMAAFMTRGQIGAAQASLANFEITMDSDDQAEFNAAIGAVFKNSLDAVSEDLGDLFGALTGNLRIDPAEMSQIAVGLLALDNALSELGLTVSAEFVNAMGGVEESLQGVVNFFNRYFTREEVLGMNLQDIRDTIENQFGDISEGVTFENFREKFEEASPTGEELARWLKLGELLGLAHDATEELIGIEEARIATLEEQAAAQQEIVDGFMAEADAMDVMADAMLRELEIRMGLTDTILENINVGQSFDRIMESNIERFRRARQTLSDSIGLWDLSTDGLRRMADAARDFHSAAIAIFNDIQTLRGIVTSGQGFLDEIRMAGMTPQQRYEFLIGRGQSAAQAAAQAEDPGEAAALINQAVGFARQAWGQLTPEQQAAMGGDFQTWVEGILGLADTIGDAWEDYLRDQGGDLLGVAESPLQASADMIQGAADVMRGAADVMRGAAELQGDNADTFREGVRIFRDGVNTFFQGAIGQPAVNAA